MNRKQKSLIITSLVEQFKQHDGFYFVDSTSLSVPAISQFKRSCHQAGVTYQVAKNTLVLKALGTLPILEKAYEPLRDQVLKGFTGILFFNENANVPAKLVSDFRKKQNTGRPLLKGAYVDGDLFLGDASLEVLSRYKSKQVLIGEIITLLQSPVAKVIAALQNKAKE